MTAARPGAERATLRMRDGATREGEAWVRRYGATFRTVTAVVILVTSLAIAAFSVVIPGVHFVAPWLVPMVGGGAAWFFFRREVVVDEVRGACPACAAAIAIERPGSLGDEPLWLRCPGCKAPVELLIPGGAA